MASDGVHTSFDDERFRDAYKQDDAPPKQHKEKDSAATKIVNAVYQRGGVEMFRDGKDAYAAVVICGHREIMAVRSRCFRLFVIRVNYELTAKIPSAQSISDALALMEAQSLFDGTERKVYVRVAPGHGNDVYIDLGGEEWRAVHVTADGWRVVNQPAIYFRRPESMRPLPLPQPGRLDDLRQFLNLANEDAFVLLKALLVAALRPRGPYPIGYIAGQQGTAKTTTCRVIRALVDPCQGSVRTAPRDEADLLIAARNSHLIALDNLSRLEPWLSDAMCRIATGGGLSKRQLYTDTDEVIIEVQKPQLLNAIEDLGFRGDFAERALTITLQRIPDEDRVDELEFWRKFEAERPRLLGGLLDAVALAVHQLPSTKLERKPRMADFALWATAAEPASAPAGAFMRAYAGNIELSQAVVLEASLIAQYITKLVDDSEGTWVGTTKELLGKLVERSRNAGNEAEQREKSWPRTPQRLSGILRRLGVALLSSGIEYTEPDRRTKARTLQLKRVATRSAPKESSAKCSPDSDSGGADIVPFADDGAASKTERHQVSDSKESIFLLSADGADVSGPGDGNLTCPACGLEGDWSTEVGLARHIAECAKVRW